MVHSNLCRALSFVALVVLPTSQCFVIRPGTTGTTAPSSSSTQLSMVFDFFKQKSTEGLSQLNRLADASYKRELGKGLSDVAAYTKASNMAFASGLARSRVQLLQNLETLFTGVSPEEVLEELQDILLQADLGLALAEEVVEEVKTLRQDATVMLSQDDLRSILRGKLIEALDTGAPGAIQFSTSEDMPTVLFVMGANGMGVSAIVSSWESIFFALVDCRTACFNYHCIARLSAPIRADDIFTSF